MKPDASTLVTLGIPALAALVIAFWGWATHANSPAATRRRSTAWFLAGALAWAAISGALAASGLFNRVDLRPPPMVLILAPTLLLPIAVARSRLGADLASALPLSLLVGFHAFRLPLELVMHQAAVEGTMPMQMSYSGYNFDIATGLTAIVVAALAAAGRAPRGLLIAWNILGSALLVAIVTIAVASLPLFAAFGSEPSQLNTWVAYFPFVWLPALLVASALLGHLLLWRRLLVAGGSTTQPPLDS